MEIRPYRAGDEEEINRSFNRVFGCSRSLVQWRQKFDDATYTMLAVDPAGRVHAQYAALPGVLQVEGRQVRAGHIVDVFSLPQARRGLAAARTMLATTQAFFATFGGPHALSVLYGFPGLRHFHLGKAKLGYDAMPPEQVPVWSAAPRPRRHFSLRARVWEDPAPQTWDLLWAEAGSRYGVAMVRDTRWRLRRFGDDERYQCFVVTAQTRPQVLGVLSRRGRVLALVDLVWSGCERGLEVALEYVRAQAWERRLDWVELWLAGDRAAAEVLAHRGWQCTPHPELHRVARSFDPAVDVATFPGRFLLTMADSDLV